MALSAEDLERIRQIVREEMMPAEIKEPTREIVAEQRRQELAAYDVAFTDCDQVARIQRAKMRELKRARGAAKAAAKGD